MADVLAPPLDRLPTFTARRGAGSGQKHEAERTLAPRSENSQSARLSPEAVEAITDALAEALVIDWLTENAPDSEPSVPSPGGIVHGEK